MVSNIYRLFFFDLLGLKRRSSRKEYIYRSFLFTPICLMISIILGLYIPVAMPNIDKLGIFLFNAVTTFFFSFQILSVNVRRLKDIGLKWWMQLLIIISLGLIILGVHIIYFILSGWFLIPLFISELFFLIQIILFLPLSLIPGTKGKNKYGDPPNF